MNGHMLYAPQYISTSIAGPDGNWANCCVTGRAASELVRHVGPINFPLQCHQIASDLVSDGMSCEPHVSLVEYKCFPLSRQLPHSPSPSSASPHPSVCGIGELMCISAFMCLQQKRTAKRKMKKNRLIASSYTKGAWPNL